MKVDIVRPKLLFSGEIETGTVVRDGDRFLIKTTEKWADLESGASVSSVSSRVEVLEDAQLVTGEVEEESDEELPEGWTIGLDYDGDPTVRGPGGVEVFAFDHFIEVLREPAVVAAILAHHDGEREPDFDDRGEN